MLPNEEAPLVERTYRIRFWPLFLFCGVASIACLLGKMALDGWLTAMVVGITVVLSMILLAPLCLVMRAMFPVRISADSIRGQDAMGTPVTPTWDSISGVTLVPVPGLPFFRVSSSLARKKIWLPGFLADPSDFLEQAQALAGAEHPLSEFLVGRRKR